MFIEKRVIVPKSKIAFFKFIIESYDGLATLSTIDKKRGELALFTSPPLEDELLRVVERIKKVV